MLPTNLAALLTRVRRLSSKPPMVAYLAALLLVSAVGVRDWSLIARGVVIVALYSAADLLVTKRREGIWYLPSSAWISGLILALVLSPSARWWEVVAAPLLASASKHLLRFRRRHVFNPAATALVILGTVSPDRGAISWWGASWGLLPLVIIVASGLVTIVRVKRWQQALAFLAVYLGANSALLLARGGTVAGLPGLLLDGTLFFFATVMLIEPVTTAYQPVWIRPWFGAAVGALAVLFSLPGVPTRIPDPLLAALLVGNVGATALGHVLRRR